LVSERQETLSSLRRPQLMRVTQGASQWSGRNLRRGRSTHRAHFLSEVRRDPGATTRGQGDGGLWRHGAGEGRLRVGGQRGRGGDHAAQSREEDDLFLDTLRR